MAYLTNESLVMVPLLLLHNDDNNSYNLAVLSFLYTVSKEYINIIYHQFVMLF